MNISEKNHERLLNMDQQKAAITIQSFFRMIYVKKHIVQQVRNEFEEIVQDVGDSNPKWEKEIFCCPSFQELNPEIEKMFIEGAILQRVATLHYQNNISK